MTDRADPSAPEQTRRPPHDELRLSTDPRERARQYTELALWHLRELIERMDRRPKTPADERHATNKALQYTSWAAKLLAE